MKLLSNPKYSNRGNSKLNPVRLTPISNTTKNPSTQSSSNINIKNNNNIIINNNINYNAQNIDKLKRGLDPNSDKISLFNENGSQKPSHHTGHKYLLKDENYYGNYIDINAQSNLPIDKTNQKINGKKRPESKGVFLPHINNNLNISTTTIRNDTHSVFSQKTTGKKVLKINHKSNRSKPMEVLMLEQECREAIEKAKAEWNVTNKELEAMIVKKIQKKYYSKIKRLMNPGFNG